MFGASSAVGVEIDPVAIQSAYRNAEMNGIEAVFLLPEETRTGGALSLPWLLLPWREETERMGTISREGAIISNT